MGEGEEGVRVGEEEVQNAACRTEDTVQPQASSQQGSGPKVCRPQVGEGLILCTRSRLGTMHLVSP